MTPFTSDLVDGGSRGEGVPAVALPRLLVTRAGHQVDALGRSLQVSSHTHLPLVRLLQYWALIGQTADNTGL